MSATGTWDIVYGITNRALNGALYEIGTLSPGIFGTTVAINSPDVEAVMVQMPNMLVSSLQPTVGNPGAASLTLISPDAQVFVISQISGVTPGTVDITCSVEQPGPEVACEVTGISVTSDSLTPYPGLAQTVSNGLAIHIYDTLLRPFQFVPSTPMLDGLGPFALSSVAFDDIHAGILTWSALAPATVSPPDPDPSWPPRGAFVGFSPALLNAALTPNLNAIVSDTGCPDPNLSWSYSVPMTADVADGLSSSIGASDLAAGTVRLTFDFLTPSPIDVTFHTPGILPNYDIPVYLNGRATVQAKIDMEPMPSPGTWQFVVNITSLESTIAHVSPDEITFSVEVDSWSIDLGTAMTDDLINAIGNALIGSRIPLMMLDTLPFTPPQGPPLALNFNNPVASAITGPGGQPMLAFVGDINVTNPG